MLFRLPEPLLASLRIDDRIPKQYNHWHMPHAEVIFMQFTGGAILSQYLKGKDYAIWQHHFIMEKATDVHPFTQQGILTLNYMLQGIIPCHLEGFGAAILRAGFYHLFYVPAGNKHRAELPEGLSISLHIDIDQQLMEQAAKQHAVFQPAIEKAASGQTTGDQHPPSSITREVAAMLQSIVTCDLPEGDRSLFLGARIRDLLLRYLHDQADQAELAVSTSREQKIMARLQQYLQDRLDQHLTVNQIAADLELSASTLQNIMRRRFYPGVYHLLQEMRMRKAMDLLATTDLPIGEIAARVTYASFTYFTRSFKKHFGRSPAYYRRLHKPPYQNEQ